MKINFQRKVILPVLSLLITNCIPQYRTDYSYEAPDNIDARKCISKCHIQKQKCSQKSESNYQKCKDKEGDDVIISSCKKYDCVPDYNDCFELCGGRVKKYTYKVDFFGNRQ